MNKTALKSACFVAFLYGASFFAWASFAAADELPQYRPLFNGKDLTGFYTWLVDTKREDPRRVFR